MKNEKCDWKRKGCLLFVTLLGTTSFFSYAKSGTDYNQLSSVRTELNNDINQQKTKKYPVLLLMKQDFLL